MKKILLISVLIVLASTICIAKEVDVTTGFGLVTYSNGTAMRNKCPIGTMTIGADDTYEVLSEEEFNAIKSYNDKRFFASLMVDESFSDLLYADFFSAVGLCLKGSGNFEILSVLLDKLIADEKITSELSVAFKAKILEEEGVTL